ncbi:GNAT family N-acetyltransferase [Bacillus sp. FJAT-27445]|uniref:GNAT family N-acetyltransferase n=1 Tax=Bacillus sp. FJAT-27445 TaxID=1679166 RepID=UPI0007441473|nr:hypothetical protein [Bacillus sp. FJAT-27445]
MEIKKLTEKDAELYRNIRLEALRAHPEAFGSSYEEELEYPLSLFEERFKNGPAVTLGAFVEGELAVTSSNSPAKKLYESLGFVTYGVDRNALLINGQYYSEDLMVLKV